MALEAFHPHIKNKVYWIVLPTYAEAKESVWKDPSMLFRVIPQELIDRQNEVELTLYLKSGSIICLKGADNPDTLRGAGPYGIVFDEFATMKYEAWGILEPVVRASGGWAWFIGTPKGKNHLYDLYNRGQGNDPEWKSWLLKASTSGIIPSHELEASKLSMPQNLFNQEWECEFLEGEGQVFRGVREIAMAKPLKSVQGHVYVMGVDLAKHQDYTAITVYDRATNMEVYRDRFNKIEWPFQKAKIKAIAEHYNKALVELDATGIGDPIADDLLRAGVNVEPYKITQQSKKDLIEKLSIWIEQKQLRIINAEETLFEFDNFTYEITPGGFTKYGAPQGYNDDIVIAHALAVWSLSPLYRARTEKEKTVIQKHLEYAKRKYEKEVEAEWGESPEDF